MRICHILSSLNLGGQERVAFDLAQGQKARGHDVFTIAMDEGNGPLATDFRLHALPVIGVSRATSGIDWKLSARLFKIFKEHRLMWCIPIIRCRSSMLALLQKWPEHD